jgi:hypothetical protein
MNKKIAIIGGGLFGITAYFFLKKNNYQCSLFEEKSRLISGASTNNLNRVHLGYHYPRDQLTTKQCIAGYNSFTKFYDKAIIKNFKNYYLIAKNSKTDFKKYINFCLKNNLSFKKIIPKNFPLNLKNIEGGIEVREPIYDWKIIKKIIKDKINKISNKKIYLNEKIIKIEKISNSYKVTSNKKKYKFDYIIDATYHGSNTLVKNFFKPKKNLYQLTYVFEFSSAQLKKVGIAIMDGKFFSFLPNGNSNKYIFYHVKYSLLKNKILKEYNYKWKNIISKKKINFLNKKILLDVKRYLPNFNIRPTGKFFISPRVLLNDVKSNDRRISYIEEISKNYFQIFSAKVDHSVEIAKKLIKILKIKKIKTNYSY